MPTTKNDKKSKTVTAKSVDIKDVDAGLTEEETPAESHNTYVPPTPPQDIPVQEVNHWYEDREFTKLVDELVYHLRRRGLEHNKMSLGNEELSEIANKLIDKRLKER